MNPYSDTNKSKTLNNLVINVNKYLTFQPNSLNLYPANKLFYMEQHGSTHENKLFIQANNLVYK